MKILDGKELAEFVKERQAKQVRGLRQAWKTFPNLAIIVAQDADSAQNGENGGTNPVIDLYVRLKQAYGADILIDVDVHRVHQPEVAATIMQLNEDPAVHGIIVQLPLPDPSKTDALLALIAPQKDVDALRGPGGIYVSATAMAIDWLLAGYAVTLPGSAIAIVGQGRLVGAPLKHLWETVGHTVAAYDETTQDLQAALRKADIIITATGVPGLITADMIAPGAVVVDAGTAASEDGQIVGDVAADVRERQDLKITPVKGGVGPLTIAALFDNVITAANKTIPPINTAGTELAATE